MASTIFSYNLTGGRVFPVAFEYLARRFVRLTLVGATRQELVLNVDYRFISKTEIETTVVLTPGAFQTLEIRRVTSATDRLVNFTDGSILRSQDLNISQIQAIHIAEEGRDVAENSMISGGLFWDALGLPIKNVGYPLLSTDAANGQYVLDNMRTALRVTPSETITEIPSDRANKVLAFDSNRQPVAITPSTGSSMELELELVDPSKGSQKVAYKYPHVKSVARSVGDRLSDRASVFDFIPVSEHAAIKAGTSTYDISPHLRDLTGITELDFGSRGNTFQMNSVVVFTKGICLHGEATIKVPLTDRAFDLLPTHGAIYPIASRGADVVYPAFGGNLVTPLTIENPFGLRRGDIVQISSDDIYTFSPAARKAELIRVLEVVGRTVYLHGYLSDDYTTSPTLTKLSTEKFHVGALTFTSQSDPYAMLTGSALGVVRAVGVAHLTCDSTFERLGGAGLNLTSCWMPMVDVQTRDLRDKLAINAYGYGVIAYGCTRYAQIKVRAERVRHAYTGGVINNPPTVMHKGTVRNTRCYDSLGVNTTAASFDTHPGEYDAQFTSCHAVFRNGDADATTSQAPGFQDRGCDTVYTACTVQGVGHGFELSGMRELHGKTNTTQLYDCWVRAGKQLSTPSVLTMRTKIAPEECEVRIYGGGFDGGTGGAVFSIGAATADLELQGTVLYNITAMRLGSGNKSRIVGCSRRNTGTAEPIIVGPGSSLVIDKYTAEAEAYSSQHLVRVGLAGEGGTGTVHAGTMSAVNRSSTLSPVGTNGTAALDLKSIVVYPLRPTRGSKSGRPVLASSDAGYIYFDTTLNKPIWWSSVSWVDGTGATV